MKIKIVNKSDNKLPSYESLLASGMDVRANFKKIEDITVKYGGISLKDNRLEIQPFSRIMVPTGIFMAIEEGYEVQVRSRSGISLKRGLLISQGTGTIDADYRGECMICLTSVSPAMEYIEMNERIAQFVVAATFQAELVEVDNLDDTERGAGGFGSTGSK